MTQLFKVENSQQGAKPLAVRIKVTYALGGAPVLEQADIKSFPLGF